jgi:hypothetical protein
MKYIQITAQQTTKTPQEQNNFLEKFFKVFNTTMQNK